MTPKEKAEELLNRFDLPTGLMSSERKQCVLICVDEIIEELDFISELMSSTYDWHRSKYWQEVKEEINKL